MGSSKPESLLTDQGLHLEKSDVFYNADAEMHIALY
jgi:hypothetical protein